MHVEIQTTMKQNTHNHIARQNSYVQNPPQAPSIFHCYIYWQLDWHLPVRLKHVKTLLGEPL